MVREGTLLRGSSRSACPRLAGLVFCPPGGQREVIAWGLAISFSMYAAGSVPVMATLPASDSSIDLRGVTVAPDLRGAQEHRRWDRLVAEHHYLRFHGVVGKGLRHVAVHGESWLALLGWQPGAFKLAARDRWVGWSAQQQFKRLHLIANNSRFVILTPERVPNLASRVLGLSLRRLSQDIEAVHGYPALLAETFVDVSRFAGTCYRASNWRSLGFTRGFAREPGGAARWRHHGQPKEVFVFELTDGAAEALSRVEIPAHWNAEQHTEPMTAPRLRSLFECLGEVPECRHARGKRYPLKTVLAVAVAARLAGYRGATAFAQFAALLSQEQLEAVGAFWSPSKQRYTAPAITTFHNILAALAPETLDIAIGRWTGQHGSAHAPVAMDGKDLRGASKQTEHGRRDDGRGSRAQHRRGPRAGRGRLQEQRNPGRACTVQPTRPHRAHRHPRPDARPARDRTLPARTPRRLRLERHQGQSGDHPRRPHRDRLQRCALARNPRQGPWPQIERRRCAVVDLTAAEWDGYANLHGRRQAMRIEREREVLNTAKRSIEVTWSLTSLGAERAGPEELLALVRNHWHIENRLHYVRDFTYDEDRCRAYVRHLPRNLACLTNAAISIVRCNARFRYLPEANRHYAARTQEALDAILIAPIA